MIQALATLLLMGVVLTSCAEDVWFQDENAKEGTYTMTVQASMGSEVTRALSPNGSTINASWAEGEEVTVYNVTRNADLSGTLVAKSSGTSTTLKGQLTGTIVAGDQLKLKFLSPTYSSQDDTLTGSANSIDKVCDYAEALVTVSSVTDGYVMTTTSASFTNQQSIVKFTLLDKGNGDAAINPTSLTISDGTSTVNLFDIPSATYTTNGNGVLYVAFPASGTAKTISLNVIGGSNHYFYEKSDVTFTNNNFYDVTVKLGSIGALPGKFTINAGGGQVSFSQGNLQYQASTSTWRFATNQYDMIGSDNANISNSYTGWIDLFGWGTGNNPTNSSTNNGDYSTCTDWGVNAISNGGNTADLWRTLSKDEWVYLFANHTKGWSNVNGVYGYVIRPDGVSTAVAASYTASGWAVEEAAGSVFLPAACSRGGKTYNAGAWGDYWTSTPYNSNDAYYLYFHQGGQNPSSNSGRFGGRSVRLVYETPFQGAGTESDPYLISSEADWIILANKVNSGNSFSGKFFRQTANINVTTMVGNSSESKPFSGTYDGDGKTLNLSLNTSTPHTAPFRLIANATIKNVVTTGTVHSTDNHPSGLVGTTDGTCTIQNCLVSANVGGAQHSGGIVGHSMHANISIIGCVYSGTLTPASGQLTGGIIGWGGDGGGHTMTISNCLFAGSVVGSTTFHPVGIVQTTNNTRTVSNTYYTVAHNMSDENTHGNSFVNGLSYKGKFARSISAGTDVTVARTGATAVYDVSGITSYDTGILYNGVLYAGNGEAVSLSLSHGAAPSGSTFNQYTVSGGGTLDNPTSNSPTLTMTDANQTINAQWNITYTAPTLRTGLTFNGNSSNVSGSAQNLVNAGSVTHGTIYYSTNGGSSWSTSLPKGTNAGSYTIHYKVEPDAGYSGGVGSTSLGSTTIAKANGWCELSSYSSSGWKSKHQSVTITITHHGGTLSNSVTNNGNANLNVSLSGNSVTISNSSIIKNAYGTVTITSAATTNYKAASATYTCNQ